MYVTPRFLGPYVSGVELPLVTPSLYLLDQNGPGGPGYNCDAVFCQTVHCECCVHDFSTLTAAVYTCTWSSTATYIVSVCF